MTTKLAGASTTWVNKHNRWHQLWGGRAGETDLCISITVTSLIYAWIRGSKAEHYTQQKTWILHNIILLKAFFSCSPSLSFLPPSPSPSTSSPLLPVSSSELWTQQSYLALPRCQREWSISGFILSGVWARVQVWSRAGAPGDKTDRDTVTCVPAVRVGMDGACSTIKRLPLCARWIGSGSHSRGGRLTSLLKGAVCLIG